MSTTLDLVPVTMHFGRIAEEVFAMMAGITLIPSGGAVGPATFSATLAFRAPVCLTLRLECEPKVAYAISTQLLGLDESPDRFNDDVRDSLGEMVNMVGGNLRNFFPELESLDTTPLVSEGRHPNISQDSVRTLIFRCAHGKVCLSLS